FRRGVIVSGQHDDVQALGSQVLESSGSGWFDRICNAQQSGGVAIDGSEDYGLSLAAEIHRLWREPGGRDMVFLQECFIARENDFAVQGAMDATPGRVAEFVRLNESQASLFGGANDRRTQRVLTSLLQAGYKLNQFRLTPLGCNNGNQAR